MSVSTQTARIRGNPATTPKITNLSLPSANIEVGHLFDDATRKIQVRIRKATNSQFAFTVTESSTKFITLRGGTVYHEDALDLNGVTIFIQTDKDTQIAEILEWK